MKVTRIHAPDFDLEKTLNSGQVFHWEKIDNGFIGTIGDLPVYVEQREGVLKVASASSRCAAEHGQDAHATIARYFALDHPLAEICASLPNDSVMNAARAFSRGLRIIRQPKWECLATFICSAMKQVAHSRQISQKLRARFGEPREIDNYVVHTFPSAQRIALVSEKELRDCALGYRARNLLATARLVATGDVDLEKMSALSDAELQAALCQLPGVGAKVANCVMLFAYERLRAFPIDVWIERVLRERYFAKKRKVTPRRLRQFTESYFGEHGGYAQQYLFHHARLTRHLSAPKA
ncbi:MAG TPA: DNA glycosylase [Chthoniobacterales bacterium]|nr:DNA glycosylase [Chthoniobacterales bacterium]